MTDPARFFHYDAAFDPSEVIRRHAASEVLPSPEHVTNYLGVRIDPRFLPDILIGRAGTIEPVPLPANWHADIAEWGAALRAVDLATGSFTAIECGCGWACWLSNTGVAARRKGLEVMLLGIEADEQYVSFANHSLLLNGFSPKHFSIRLGISAGRAGVAYFPRLPTGGTDWGRSPIFVTGASPSDHTDFTGTHMPLPCVPLQDLPHGGRVDLLHVDIQGGELTLLSESLAFLIRHVAYIVIGTHSRSIEGRLWDLLSSNRFVLEVDRPAIHDLAPTPVLRVDGVQAWRNTDLLP